MKNSQHLIDKSACVQHEEFLVPHIIFRRPDSTTNLTTEKNDV